MKGMLIIGGNAPDSIIVAELSRDFDIIAAADSGFDVALEAGISPDIVLGDFDSVKSSDAVEDLPKHRLMKFPEDKDATDTEIGLSYLHRSGCSHITIIGGGGGRLDHLIGILRLFERDMRPHVWRTDTAEVISIENEYEYHGKRGDTVSFFPVGHEICTMNSTGLKWPLDGLEWGRGDVGISNIVPSGRCRVLMKTGRLLMVREV